MKPQIYAIALVALLHLAACETISSPPYTSSTENVLAIQSALHPSNAKVQLGAFSAASSVNLSPKCRGVGLDLGNGRSIPDYIRDAMQQELFLAQAYATDAPVMLVGRIEHLALETMTTGSWTIDLTLSAGDKSYRVSHTSNFKTSFSAANACTNATNAFGPAVRELLKTLVTDPQFKLLVVQ